MKNLRDINNPLVALSYYKLTVNISEVNKY